MPDLRNLQLTHTQQGEFQEVILDAFDRDRLKEALYYRIGKRLDNFANTGSFETDVFRLLDRARQEGWQADLMRAARDANPGNPRLVEFMGRLDAGLTVATPKLEKRVREQLPFLSLGPWRARLGAIEFQVCRIEIPEREAKGTGFLVGPDVVMTNYHVMERIIDRSIAPDRVALRFDYKQSPEGVTVHEGTVHRLAAEWLLDESRYSDTDLLADPFTGASEPDRLDYALLRLSKKAGLEPAGGSSDGPAAPRRGWVTVPDAPRVPARGDPLFIVQHPDGRPLEVALDTDSVVGANAQGTRIRYMTNTEGGSSGSPCFDVEWNWVALHHSGDPKSGPLYKPQYNAGIPLPAIAALLQQRGKRDLLAAPNP